MRLRLLIAALASLAIGGTLPAQEVTTLPAAGAPGPAAAGHGWATLPIAGEKGAVAVIHLPPRGPAVPDGTVRVVTQLPAAPERMAGWENRLYLAFPPEPAGGREKQRRVHMLSVQAGGVEGSWAPAQEGSRLPALPSLPGAGSLLGLAAAPMGPVALMERGDGGAELLLLVGSEWKRAALPPGLPGGDEMTLVPGAGGFELVTPGAGRAWAAKPAPDGASVDWEQRTIRVPPGPGGSLGTPEPVAHVGGGHAFWSRPSATSPLVLLSATAGGVHTLAELRGLPPEFAVAPLLRNQRLVVIWSEPTPAAQAPAPRTGLGPPPKAPMRTRMVEVSAATGRILYEGSARVAGPVSAQELRLLAAALVAVMAVILLFILRPDQSAGALTLPAGFALAEPLRRLIAGAIDVLIAAIIAGRLTGVAVGDLFSPTALLTGLTPLHAFLLMVGLGIVLGTICEAIWGRTLGKVITGCEVIRPAIRIVEGSPVSIPRRPTVLRSLGRNLVKWVLPPVAVSGAFAPERRHRGDIIAGAVVVIRTDEPEATPEDEAQRPSGSGG